MATGLEIKYKRSFGSLKSIGVFVMVGILGLSIFYGYRWYTTGEQPPVPIPAAIALADPSVSETPVPIEEVNKYTVSELNPRYLSIPDLNIAKVRVMTVGVNETGQLDTPKNINDVAWYNKSVTPGQGSGAVLIDGLSTGYSKDGVFAKLDTLPLGAKLSLERGDGKVYNYEVVENKSMTLEEVNKTGMKDMMFSAQSDKEGLNLISYSGRYIPKDKVFDHRIMLRAVRMQ